MSKQTDTWMPLVVDAYLGDTTHLSTLQHGAYLLLLMAMWKKGGRLPSNEHQLQQITRLKTGEWKSSRAVLMEFFTVDGDAITQKRLGEELARAKAATEAKAKAGAKGAETRWGKGKGNGNATGEANADADGTAMATPSGSHWLPNASIPIPTQSPTGDSIPPIPPAKAGGKPKRQPTAAVELRTWLEAERAANRKAVPEDDAVFAYARDVGLPLEFLRLAWVEFRHRYSQPNSKRYRNWRQVFRKAVRGNWLKLWYLDQANGVFSLTTVGEQARRAAAALAPEKNAA